MLQKDIIVRLSLKIFFRIVEYLRVRLKPIQVEHINVHHSMGWLKALLTNTGLTFKNFPVTNAAAFFSAASEMKKKSFVTLTP
jgi:hypothetical protein